MRQVKISKHNGKFRTIYVPDAAEKALLRSLLPALKIKMSRHCSPACHGFVTGKSPVTNAAAHVGYQFSLCFDLENFFDTVNENHLRDILTSSELSQVLVDGAPRQGLPTSPAVANIAAAAFDQEILDYIDHNKLQVVYTRYADDLTFSYNDTNLTATLKAVIPDIIVAHGFKLNHNKTHCQSARHGRRIITGVAVDAKLHPTRKIKRKLRAALHQQREWEAQGLVECSKLKMPRHVEAPPVIKETPRTLIDELEEVPINIVRMR